MSDTTFVSGTVIAAAWLNDINDTVYGLRQTAALATSVGADPTGVTDATTLLQTLIDTGKHVVLNGIFKISSPLQPTQAGISGLSPDTCGLLCNACHGIEIASGAGFDRPAAIFEKFSINSVSNSCDSKYAFYIPGVAASAAAVYNSGVTIQDIEIGRTGKMGGGFYLKDLFRCNIANVGLTDVSHMIRVVGSVVQLKVSNVTSNNDSAASSLSKYGISTESATYASGVLTPENCHFDDCSYIRGTTGINHTSGLDMDFENFDCESTTYGMYLNAACTVDGGIIVPQAGATAYVGVYRGVSPADPDDATILNAVDVNALNTPSGTCYGYQMGDGVSPVYGFIMKNCRLRGNANSFTKGIYGRDLRDCTIEDCFIRTAAVSGNDMELTGRRMFVNRNRVIGGTLVISDGGESTAYGSVIYNQCTALTFAPTVQTNWDVRQNETLKRYNWGRTSVADGGTISHGLDSTPASVVCTPITTGEFVSVTSLGASTFTVAIKKHDNSAGTTQFVNWIAQY